MTSIRADQRDTLIVATATAIAQICRNTTNHSIAVSIDQQTKDFLATRPIMHTNPCQPALDQLLHELVQALCNLKYTCNPNANSQDERRKTLDEAIQTIKNQPQPNHQPTTHHQPTSLHDRLQHAANQDDIAHAITHDITQTIPNYPDFAVHPNLPAIHAKATARLNIVKLAGSRLTQLLSRSKTPQHTPKDAP